MIYSTIYQLFQTVIELRVLISLHKMIERYDKLKNVPDFDNYGNAIMPKVKTADYKPLIQYLKTLIESYIGFTYC